MKHIKIIAKILDEKEKKLKPNCNLNNFIWDSMAKINLITYINEKYNKNINIKKMKSIKTVKELDELINFTIKK